jgi:hypothetical protein
MKEKGTLGLSVSSRLTCGTTRSVSSTHYLLWGGVNNADDLGQNGLCWRRAISQCNIMYMYLISDPAKRPCLYFQLLINIWSYTEEASWISLPTCGKDFLVWRKLRSLSSVLYPQTVVCYNGIYTMILFYFINFGSISKIPWGSISNITWGPIWPPYFTFLLLFGFNVHGS